PSFGSCNPVGEWKVAYAASSQWTTCIPADESMSISYDADGGLRAAIGIDPAINNADGGIACAAGTNIPSHHEEAVFDPIRCELTLTQTFSWCDPGVEQDQRSLVITFDGDHGVGSGVAHATACGPYTTAGLCVSVDRM